MFTKNISYEDSYNIKNNVYKYILMCLKKYFTCLSFLILTLINENVFNLKIISSGFSINIFVTKDRKKILVKSLMKIHNIL